MSIQKKIKFYHTINVKTEKDRTFTSTTKVDRNTKITYQDQPLRPSNNVSWGLTEKDDDEWDIRYKQEMERTGGMYCEDVLDDIINWCNVSRPEKS